MLWALAIFGCFIVLLALVEAVGWGIPTFIKSRFEEQGEFGFNDCLIVIFVLARACAIFS